MKKCNHCNEPATLRVAGGWVCKNHEEDGITNEFKTRAKRADKNPKARFNSEKHVKGKTGKERRGR